MSSSSAVGPVCIIVNQAAGTAFKTQSESWRETVATAELLEIEDDGWRERAAAATRAGRRLVAAGGDGTVHAVSNVLVSARRGGELGVIPVGTGNDLARALGIPVDDLDAALRLALHGVVYEADAVEVRRDDGTVRHFVNMCYGGFGERVADQIEPESKARWGLLPHWIQLARQAINMPTYSVEVRTPQGSAQLDLHGLLIANSNFLGGGVPAAPHARLNDGLMNVALVPVQSLWDRFVTSVEFLSGQIDESEGTLSFVADEMSIRATPEMQYTMDGEAAPDGPLSFRVLKGALRLVGAEAAPAFAEEDESE